MIDTGDLRKGVTIELDGNLYNIVDWEHVKVGRGGAVVRLKLRDMRARVERQPTQFLYADGGIFYFMNTETFDQIAMNQDRVGENELYMKENEGCSVLTFGEEAISVELPAAVVLTVTQTDPGLKGDTAQGGTKPATMETGVVVQVPLFVNEGDKIKVDTRSGAYLERSTS